MNTYMYDKNIGYDLNFFYALIILTKNIHMLKCKEIFETKNKASVGDKNVRNTYFKYDEQLQAHPKCALFIMSMWWFI